MQQVRAFLHLLPLKGNPSFRNGMLGLLYFPPTAMALHGSRQGGYRLMKNVYGLPWSSSSILAGSPALKGTGSCNFRVRFFDLPIINFLRPRDKPRADRFVCVGL